MPKQDVSTLRGTRQALNGTGVAVLRVFPNTPRKTKNGGFAFWDTGAFAQVPPASTDILINLADQTLLHLKSFSNDHLQRVSCSRK